MKTGRERKKGCKKMLFSEFCKLRKLVFEQSSPGDSVNKIKGGTLIVKYRAAAGRVVHYADSTSLFLKECCEKSYQITGCQRIFS